MGGGAVLEGGVLIEEEITIRRTANGLGDSFFNSLGIYLGENLGEKM